MSVRETSTSSNDDEWQPIAVENMGQVSVPDPHSDLQEPCNAFSQLNASNCQFSNRSWIDQSSFDARNRRGSRRWKLINYFRCISVRDEQDAPSSRGAPPTYSSIFTGSIFNEFTFPTTDRPSSNIIMARIPPPTYSQAQREIYLTESSRDPLISLSPTNNWSRAPAATICPRCEALIITVVVIRRSTISHIAALMLFMFGCWPCCMIPYCIDSCNNADHYCPICRVHLGTCTS